MPYTKPEEILPMVVPANPGSKYEIALRWIDENGDMEIYPLLLPSEDKFPGMAGLAFSARVTYVGPVTSFPNESLIRRVAEALKNGMGAWFVQCVVPYPDQERPWRQFPMEIDQVWFFNSSGKLPQWFHKPEIVGEIMHYAYDRLG